MELSLSSEKEISRIPSTCFFSTQDYIALFIALAILLARVAIKAIKPARKKEDLDERFVVDFLCGSHFPNEEKGVENDE